MLKICAMNAIISWVEIRKLELVYIQINVFMLKDIVLIAIKTFMPSIKEVFKTRRKVIFQILDKNIKF